MPKWAGLPCIIESNFPPVAAGELLALQQAHSFRPFQIVCRAEGVVLLARFAARAGRRHPGHGDEALLDELGPTLLAAEYAPLAIGGVLWELDTADFDAVDLQGLFEALERELGR